MAGHTARPRSAARLPAKGRAKGRRTPRRWLPKARPGRRKDAATARRWAPVLPEKEARHKTKNVASIGAPSPSLCARGKGMRAHPAPAQTTRAAKLWLLLIPPLKGEGRRAKRDGVGLRE